MEHNPYYKKKLNQSYYFDIASRLPPSEVQWWMKNILGVRVSRYLKYFQIEVLALDIP